MRLCLRSAVHVAKHLDNITPPFRWFDVLDILCHSGVAGEPQLPRYSMAFRGLLLNCAFSSCRQPSSSLSSASAGRSHVGYPSPSSWNSSKRLMIERIQSPISPEQILDEDHDQLLPRRSDDLYMEEPCPLRLSCTLLIPRDTQQKGRRW